ncbi:hypothetical protein KR093_002213, partial [Drosophila rubida]
MLKIIVCLFVVASGISAASVGRLSNVANVANVAVVANTATAGRLVSDIEKPKVAQLLRYEVDKKPNGSFRFEYEGDDNSYRQEAGDLVNVGTDEEALEVKGSYRYTDADGQVIEVHYTAGKNGFVPFGTNIPNEISLAAKAAADLPDNTYEEEQELRLKQRRARAQIDGKQEAEAKPQLKVAASEIVPVKVLVEE